MRGLERWTEHTRDLPPLAPGSKVLIQNQYGAGKISKKWDKSGMILENLGFNKYRVKVDGSGRITERNRQFLKKFTPVTPTLPGPSPNASYYEPTVNPNRPTELNPQPVVNPIPTSDQTNIPAISPPISPPRQLREPASSAPTTPESPTFVTPPSSPALTPTLPDSVGEQPTLPETPTLPRRSTRVSRPPDRLTYTQF